MQYPQVLTRRPRQVGSQVRERLLGELREHEVVVLVGPSGSGKSVLAGQLVDEVSRRSIWIRLAKGTESSEALVGLVLQALGNNAPSANDSAGEGALLLELLEEQPTALVIDDYHLAAAMSCDAVLAEVAQYVPRESRLIVLSRTRPAGLIGRVGHGLITVVSGQDLAFTEDEAEEFLGEDGLAWREMTAGWAAAMGLAKGVAAGADLRSFEGLVRRQLIDDLEPELVPAVELLGVVPYVEASLLESIDRVDLDSIQRVAQISALVTEADGSWRLCDAAAEVIRTSIPNEQRRLIALEAAESFLSADPVVAVELLLDYEAYDEAAAAISARLGNIALQHAIRWVYRLPAELRHKLPPVLTGARATVDLDLAFVEAERRLNEAVTVVDVTHAQFGLASVYAARGELALAADLLESSIRSSLDDHGLLARMSTELARVRWLSGDGVGAQVALRGANESAVGFWIQGMLSLSNQDPAGMREIAERAIASETDSVVVGRSLLALSLALDGDLRGAPTEAELAYELGLESGGHDLGCATVSMVLVLLTTEQFEQVPIFLDQLERKVGRRETSFRAFAASLRMAAAVASKQTGDELERTQRRVADFQKLGLREVDQIVHSFVGQLSGKSDSELVVQLVGEFRVAVDGLEIASSSWRTNKAKEVLVLLACHGSAGLRREQAIEYVWPSQDPNKGRTRLRTALSEIRRVLEPNRDAGQASRFVKAQGDRVSLSVASDVERAFEARERGEDLACFELLSQGLAPELPDADWLSELGSLIDRHLIEAAEKLSLGGSSDQQIAAFRVLVSAEPWQRSHIDRLAGALRDAGDGPGANAVERKWFEDD